MNFSELSKEELWHLRQEMVLSSNKVIDYKNSFGFNPSAIQCFFEEYLDFINELIEETYGFNYRFSEECWYNFFEEFDTPNNLQEHFDSYYDFNWMDSFK